MSKRTVTLTESEDGRMLMESQPDGELKCLVRDKKTDPLEVIIFDCYKVTIERIQKPETVEI